MEFFDFDLQDHVAAKALKLQKTTQYLVTDTIEKSGCLLPPVFSMPKDGPLRCRANI